MRRMLPGLAFGVGMATVGLIAARTLAPGRFPLELDVYLLVVGGLVALTVVLTTRAAHPRAGRSALAEALARGPRGPIRPLELERLEREVTLGTTTAFDLHFRLRPTLREVAEQRLADYRGLRLDDGGPAVEDALGEELWELVRPDREPPELRYEPGLSRDAVVRVVDRLEAIR